MRKLKVGACQVNITPELPANLGGMFKRYKTSEVLDPLYASSVVVDNGETCLAIVSCDLGILRRDTVEYIRENVCKATGILPSNINIMATHTHTGPDMGAESIFRQRDDQLITSIADKITLSVIEANSNKKPAKLGYGKGTVNRCGFNRRYIMSNGKSMMNPFGINNPNRLMVEGPVDREVQVVWFEDTDGNYISVMVNFSSHSAIFYGCNWVSADYPGMMRSVVQGIFGKNLPVLFLQGACGNVDTFDFEHDDLWGKGIDGYKRIGRIMSGEVLKIISENRAISVDDVEIKIFNKIIHLPFREIDDTEINRVKELWRQIPEEDKKNLDAFQIFKDLEKAAYINNVITIDTLKRMYGKMPVEVVAFTINDIFFVTNPAELFVEYQIEIKERFKDYRVIVTELSNGWINYVPTRQAIALGGYEVMQRRFCDDAGKIITQASIELIENIIRKLL